MGGRGSSRYSTRALSRSLNKRINELNNQIKSIRAKARAKARSSMSGDFEKYGVNRDTRRLYREELYYYLGEYGYGTARGELRRRKRELSAIRRGQRSLFG